MKKKHLLFTVLVAASLQFVQGQELPSESRMLEIQHKLASQQNSPLSIQKVLTADEYKDYVRYSQSLSSSYNNTNRGEGELLWAYGDSSLNTAAKVGPYNFTSQGSMSGDLFGDDINGEGILYAVDYTTKQIVTIANDGSTEPVFVLSNLTSEICTGLSWNSQNDTFYLLTTDGTDSHLSSIDMETGETTLVATFPEVIGIWVEINDNNEAFIADINTDALYSYDFNTEEIENLGAVGYDLNYAQDADYDSETGVLYAAMFQVDLNETTSGAIASVDMETGQFTPLEAFGPTEYLTLTVADELPEAEVPEPVIFGCGDVFVDSGGELDTYQSNEFETYVIEPDNDNEAVTITFTQVDIEASSGGGIQGGCWDYLSIYNGDSALADVIAPTLCGTESLQPSVAESLLSVGDSFTSTDPSGALTVTFTSDSSVERQGWQADITCSVMGVDEVQLSKFNFYPNPTNGQLQVGAQSNIEYLELYNVLGQKVFEAKPQSQNFSLNMSSLKPGAYILRATVNGQVITNKVMKK